MDSLLSGVSGLQANQKMLDVAGNNLANLNTTGFKSSRVSFSQVLGSTLKEASAPTSTLGGTDPAQIGGGVQVASVDQNMTQGTMNNTGVPLDMAINGSGFFVLNNGTSDVYTRAGAFSVDSQNYLVDASTGYRVQRTGSEGLTNGFQSNSNNDIQIPYNVSLPAQATTQISFSGNLSAADSTPTQNIISTGQVYTVKGQLVTTGTLLTDLDQSTALASGDKIVISGSKADGTAVPDTDFALFNSDGTSKTFGDLATAVGTLFPDSTVTVNGGQIQVADKVTGYSLTDVKLAFSGSTGHSLSVPTSFTVNSAGGADSMNTSIEVYDTQGVAHTVSTSFVKTNETNKWDLVCTSVSGDAQVVQGRVKGIVFGTDGSFAGVTQADNSFQFTFADEGNNVSKVQLNFGTVGGFNGVTQLGGTSTAAASNQDGYGAGSLSSMSVNQDGVLVGVFTNGQRADVAAIKLATFQNPAGLASVGHNYFATSANSGDPVACKALSGGAGSISGGTLEQSNVDMASEFVDLIQAQNGYQANARTISVASTLVQTLTQLIH
jgi:flagellar hook protein FlgE